MRSEPRTSGGFRVLLPAGITVSLRSFWNHQHVLSGRRTNQQIDEPLLLFQFEKARRRRVTKIRIDKRDLQARTTPLRWQG